MFTPQEKSGSAQQPSKGKTTSSNHQSASSSSTSSAEFPSQSSSPVPKITLPKGGGAIRGIGEKFSMNPVTGTGSFSVPIFTTPGRADFHPVLSLNYDSGSGNSPFGVGWSLPIPSITRKTDKGLPRYRGHEESDTFLLSGSEDLVPALKEVKEGTSEKKQWKSVHRSASLKDRAYDVQQYRPRIEGLFARIERWTQIETGKVFWISITKGNVISIYGQHETAQIRDPLDHTKVFQWLLEQSYDEKGNVIIYEYKQENGQGISFAQTYERHRFSTQEGFTNRYIKRIRYGNTNPYKLGDSVFDVGPSQKEEDWCFHIVFDYGEHDAEDPDPVEEPTEWSPRQDPFSTYRAGFEIRTYRLCQRVLMFHQFPKDLGKSSYLVKSTDLTYSPTPVVTYLQSITQTGYVWETPQYPQKTFKKSLPSLEFTYAKPLINYQVQKIDAQSLENLPVGLDGNQFQWVDLDGEGLSGVLVEQSDGWYYKRNLGLKPSHETGMLQLGALEVTATKPSLAVLAGGQGQFLDLAGNGQLDVAFFGGAHQGFYERTLDQQWESFRHFTSMPNIYWQDANLRFVDLTGDGHADVLITEQEAILWYPSKAEAGFGLPERIRKRLDEEKGPTIVFGDGTQTIFLGDMSGDGLNDIVRIRNGDVCYWPNMGYGQFGAKVTMGNAPVFDHPDLFDPQRLRLNDVEGSGTTDILYLSEQGVQIYFNQSGNHWSKVTTLSSFPRIDDLSQVTVVDLLGKGTGCLVWSSSLSSATGNQMQYIDLMKDQKPHLLLKIENNLGVETHLEYTSSTKFYLQDRENGKPWITKLPFPVQVVERIITKDRINRSQFVTRYAYHHGYFDGEEREFRGFGMVEQWDTETFDTFEQLSHVSHEEEGQQETEYPTNIDEASHIPPVHTKTWFHTGVYKSKEQISVQLASEYYGAPREDGSSGHAKLKDFIDTEMLDDTVLPPELTASEEREACRALKGAMLRQEVYALDGTDKEPHPYTVTEQNFTISVLQTRGQNRHAVYFTHPREVVTYQYERNPEDPRVQHALTLEVDDFGNVERSLAVNYPRRNVEGRLPEQNQTPMVLTVNRFANRGEQPNWYRVGAPVESQTFEVVKPPQPTNGWRFSFEESRSFTQQLFPTTLQTPDMALLWPYQKWNWRDEISTLKGPKLRLIEHVRTVYRKDDLSDSLPLGELESKGLPFESYQLALTPDLLTTAFQDRVTEALLNKGGYVHSEGDANWWIPSGQIFYSPSQMDSEKLDTPAEELRFAEEHFFLPHRFRDPFGYQTTLFYDDYHVLLQESIDPLQNTITVGERSENDQRLKKVSGQDYRVMQPYVITDPNRNRSAVRFDALGMVVGTAVMGKREENLGDSLDGLQPDVPEPDLADLIEKSVNGDSQALIEHASTRLVYDLFAYARTRSLADPQPTVVYTLARETHHADLQGDEQPKIQHSFSYSDGFGREIQQKVGAEPGPVPKRNAKGKIDLSPSGQPELTTEAINPRWVGTGWTVFNNKGKPVRQYEPFFTDTHRYEFDLKIGVSPILFYDPVERVVATLNPNHTYEKVVFTPWGQETWDVNDTVTIEDPKNDPDVGAWFERISEKEYLPTWYRRHRDSEMKEKKHAARLAAEHANTPTKAYLDALGRPFLTTEHNGVDTQGKPKIYETKIIQDIEGNQRIVIDARHIPIMRYDYDLLSNQLHSDSRDAGKRWMLNNVESNPFRQWNSHHHTIETEYDSLQRPTHLWVTNQVSRWLAERAIYGESLGVIDSQALNLRGQGYMQFDGAGVVVQERYDFKGNSLRISRRQAKEFKTTPTWTDLATKQKVEEVSRVANALLESETFVTHSRYDALNRPIQLTSPHTDSIRPNVIQPTYNEANLLDGIEVWLRREMGEDWLLESGTEDVIPVKKIDYDAKGQRTKIQYDNGTTTTYEYDDETFRLEYLVTLRNADEKRLQGLRYTYDPVGNITTIRDNAHQAVFFKGQQVSPEWTYQYDPLYRLVKGTGREHRGQTSQNLSCHKAEHKPHYDFNDSTRLGLPHPHDGAALRNYTESYTYDSVGNFMEWKHVADKGSWSRKHITAEDSNRLLQTSLEGDKWLEYHYDEHGNMTAMPHLQRMVWDFKDQLQSVETQVVNDCQGGMVYFTYDSSGERVRKVSIDQNGRKMEERLYLGGFELYRKYLSDQDKPELERETLHIIDDQQRVLMIETKTRSEGKPVTQPRPVYRYQLDNHLGSACLELNEKAKIITYEEYHPYGTTAYQAKSKDTEVSQMRYRYTGKERDEETGLGYHGARYYVPWLGRWTTTDPIGLQDGLNLYSYVSSNPISWKDSSGLEKENELVRRVNSNQQDLRKTKRFLIRLEVQAYPPKTMQNYQAEMRSNKAWKRVMTDLNKDRIQRREVLMRNRQLVQAHTETHAFMTNKERHLSSKFKVPHILSLQKKSTTMESLGPVPQRSNLKKSSGTVGDPISSQTPNSVIAGVAGAAQMVAASANFILELKHQKTLQFKLGRKTNIDRLLIVSELIKSWLKPGESVELNVLYGANLARHEQLNITTPTILLGITNKESRSNLGLGYDQLSEDVKVRGRVIHTMNMRLFWSPITLTREPGEQIDYKLLKGLSNESFYLPNKLDPAKLETIVMPRHPSISSAK